MNVNEQAGWHLSKHWAYTECFVCVLAHVRTGACVCVCVWSHQLLWSLKVLVNLCIVRAGVINNNTN